MARPRSPRAGPRPKNALPMPTSPPDSDIASIVVRPGRMPAPRAAAWLKPVARSSKPSVVRNSSHDTTAAIASATTKP